MMSVGSHTDHTAGVFHLGALTVDDAIEEDLQKMGEYLLKKSERANAAIHVKSIYDVLALLQRAIAELQRRRGVA